jgi:hypothetical protein
MKRIIAALGVGSLIGATGMALPADAATTYRACVKKKTGQTRMMAKKQKKCPKGWTKVTWKKKPTRGDAGSPGTAGPVGPSSTLGTVIDGVGTRVGTLVGFSWGGPDFQVYLVQSDLGQFLYVSNGWVYPNGSPKFADAACATTPFLTISQASDLPLVQGNPQFRFVYRTTDGGLGPAKAYRLTETVTPVAGLSYYEYDDAGACQLSAGVANGFTIDLAETQAPQDRTGPLRVQ